MYRDTLPLEMSFATATLASRQRLLPDLRTLFVAEPQNRARRLILRHEKRTPYGVPFRGGESEIRTLEPCYRLHDFQSCALDQLGDFSVRST